MRSQNEIIREGQRKVDIVVACDKMSLEDLVGRRVYRHTCFLLGV